MKAAIATDTLEIFMDKQSKLHISFSCEQQDNANTKEVFEELKKHATNSNPIKWYKISPDFSMSYDEKADKLDFMETSSNTTNFIDLFPRKLSVDWNIIDKQEQNLLTTFIRFHPVITERKNSDSVESYSNNFK